MVRHIRFNRSDDAVWSAYFDWRDIRRKALRVPYDSVDTACGMIGPEATCLDFWGEPVDNRS